MVTRTRVLIAAGITVATILTGTGVVLAAGGDDEPLRGNVRARATEAALDEVGGTVVETEIGDDGAAYGVEIRKPDGSVVEVNLDRNFDVTNTESDDD